MSLGTPGVSTFINSSNTFVYGNSASGNALSVQQLGAGPVFATSNANGTIGLFLNARSNVGIGITNPTQTFHVYSAAAGNPTGGSGTGADSNAAMRIQMQTVGLDIGTTGSGYTWFQNRQPGVSLGNNTLPMSLNPLGGNVGIGTTNPSATLHIGDGTAYQNGTTSMTKLSIMDSTVGTNGAVEMQIGRSGVANDAFFIGHSNVGAGSTSNYLFVAPFGTATPPFTVTAGSRVGIGTAGPASTLHVQGAILSANSSFYSLATTALVPASTTNQTIFTLSYAAGQAGMYLFSAGPGKYTSSAYNSGVYFLYLVIVGTPDKTNTNINVVSLSAATLSASGTTSGSSVILRVSNGDSFNGYNCNFVLTKINDMIQ